MQTRSAETCSQRGSEAGLGELRGVTRSTDHVPGPDPARAWTAPSRFQPTSRNLFPGGAIQLQPIAAGAPLAPGLSCAGLARRGPAAALLQAQLAAGAVGGSPARPPAERRGAGGALPPPPGLGASVPRSGARRSAAPGAGSGPGPGHPQSGHAAPPAPFTLPPSRVPSWLLREE